MKLKTFEERFEYLKEDGHVGEDTFGSSRYLNQQFYRSYEWRKLRNQIIVRDLGRDLGMEGHEIQGRVLIHHINSISVEDLIEMNESVMDPENLICVSHRTHNAIHYGDECVMPTIVERSPNDTCPWKRG